MPKKKPEKVREYKVGDRILVNLHRGRIEEATAIIECTIEGSRRPPPDGAKNEGN